MVQKYTHAEMFSWQNVLVAKGPRDETHCKPKAELLQEGLFSPHPYICHRRFVMKKLEIEKTKSTYIISVLKVEY